jgi:hypothetical protein
MAYPFFLEATFFRDLAKVSLNDDFATALPSEGSGLFF